MVHRYELASCHSQKQRSLLGGEDTSTNQLRNGARNVGIQIIPPLVVDREPLPEPVWCGACNSSVGGIQSYPYRRPQIPKNLVQCLDLTCVVAELIL